MAFDYEYTFPRNFGGDGLHIDPDTFDLGHEGESDPSAAPPLLDLNDRISADDTNFGGNSFKLVYDGNTCRIFFENPLTFPQEAALNQHVADQRVQADWNILADLKTAKMAEIDARTVELINEGFTYNAVVFSLSGQSQNNLLGVRAAIINAKVTGTTVQFEAAFFPLDYNSKDDLNEITLNTIAEFEAFFDTAMGKVRVILDGGTGLKKQVRAAVDKAGVDAVVDNR